MAHKSHTGKMGHEDLPMHHAHHSKGKDKHASKEHHAANREHDMDGGIHGPHSDGGGYSQHGGEGMAGNVEMC